MSRLGKQIRMKRVLDEDTNTSVICALDHGMTSPVFLEPLADIEARAREAVAGGPTCSCCPAGCRGWRSGRSRARPRRSRTCSRRPPTPASARASPPSARWTRRCAPGPTRWCCTWPWAARPTAGHAGAAGRGRRGACEELGMPFIAEAEWPSAYSTLTAELGVDYLLRSVRVCAELGADIVKTNWPGSKEDFGRLVEATSGLPVVLAGGSRITERELLDAPAGGHGGRRGRLLGRAQHLHARAPRAMARALTRVIVDRWPADQALDELEGARRRPDDPDAEAGLRDRRRIPGLVPVGVRRRGRPPGDDLPAAPAQLPAAGLGGAGSPRLARCPGQRVPRPVGPRQPGGTCGRCPSARSWTGWCASIATASPPAPRSSGWTAAPTRCAASVERQVSVEEWYAAVGCNLDGSHVAAKIAWVGGSGPTLHARTRRYLLPGAYMVAVACDADAVDRSNASSTMALDPNAGRGTTACSRRSASIPPGSRRWSGRRAARRDHRRVRRRHRASARDDRRVRLRRRDGRDARRGRRRAGRDLRRPGYRRAGLRRRRLPLRDRARIAECHPHAAPGRWLLENPGWASGASYRWFRDQLGGGLDYEGLNALAAEAPAGPMGSSSPRGWAARWLPAGRPRRAAAGTG